MQLKAQYFDPNLLVLQIAFKRTTYRAMNDILLVQLGSITYEVNAHYFRERGMKV